MDAFEAVDRVAAKAVVGSDQQRDWNEWREGGGAAEPALPQTTRHRPAFPKLGAAPADERSHQQVGLDEAPRAKAGKKAQTETKSEGKAEEEAPAPSPGAPPAEGAGWQELREPETGKVYWFHPATGATREAGGKEQPVATRKRGRAPNPMEQVQQALAKHLASQARQASGAGAPAPSGAGGRGAARAPATAGAAWARVEDPLSRQTVLVNARTGETRPEDSQSPAAGAKKAKRETWQRGRDPDTGKPFWMCRETGEVRKSKPKT